MKSRKKYKKVKLTHNKVALVDIDDFEKLNEFKWHYHKNGYACSNFRISGKFHYMRMHRLVINAPAEKQVDHINGNRLDNRKNNLRLVNSAQQSWNKRPRGRFKGVSMRPINKYPSRLWQASIKFNGKQFYLGDFKSKKAAASAYNAAAKKYFGKYACLNKL